MTEGVSSRSPQADHERLPEEKAPLFLVSEEASPKSCSASESDSLEHACQALLADQRTDGCWSYELEADCTIPAEYILMLHFMDELDAALEAKLACYLRARQNSTGGWPLYYGGKTDVSCSVKVYYALKLVGDDVDAPHMRAAREAILELGGAARANVFTRITLALFQQIPWHGVPFVPVELIFMPRWFPVTIHKVSYWSRTVAVPLSILVSLKARARNPRGIGIGELFTVSPEEETNWFPVRTRLNRAFLYLEEVARKVEPWVARLVRPIAIRKAERWILDRLVGADGLGAIFPAIVNSYEALSVLGHANDAPGQVTTRNALKQLLIEGEQEAYCQPCVSPVWDTALASLALTEYGYAADQQAILSGLDWLRDRQLLDEPGDWRIDRPHLRGGGWAFQFDNPYYPDVDDTSAVALALLRADSRRYHRAIEHAAEWICGMQSSNGGWGAFDVDNTYEYLNEVPFADHGALLDPPTSDVTARCVTFLAELDKERYRSQIRRGIGFLRQEQTDDGCWYGRWGCNYLYGTWCVLLALEAVGDESERDLMEQAVAWLKSVQQADGGWGETNDSYADPSLAGQGASSTSAQTAWAMLALMAAGEPRDGALADGAKYLCNTQRSSGLWSDAEFNAPGFPRVFYLKYHGYSRYFPLWALARYRRLGGSLDKT